MNNLTKKKYEYHVERENKEGKLIILATITNINEYDGVIFTYIDVKIEVINGAVCLVCEEQKIYDIKKTNQPDHVLKYVSEDLLTQILSDYMPDLEVDQ